MAGPEAFLSKGRIRGSTDLILVSVGNAHQPFRRLLDAVDAAAEENIFRGEPVLVQAGHTPFSSTACTAVDFLTMQEFIDAVRNATVLICHGGAGTLHHAFAYGKIPVVMPRRVHYGEHVDDQYDLVKVLADSGRVIPAYEAADLPSAIERAMQRTHDNVGTSSREPALVAVIAGVLDELMRSESAR